MAEMDCVTESGIVNQQYGYILSYSEEEAAARRAAFVPSDRRAFANIQAALERLAEAAANAGNTDESDWSDVYAAMRDAHVVIEEWMGRPSGIAG